MRHVNPSIPSPADDADLSDRAGTDGFFVIEHVIDDSSCDELAARLQDYASGARAPLPGMLLQQEPAIARAGRHRPGGADIRKIDGLYHDELFRQLIEDDVITRPLKVLLGSQLRLFRATALMKPAAVGSEKGMHQDAPYWPIEPMSMWSCWIPLDDATLENGCLMVVPGSHLQGPRPHHATEDDFVVEPESFDHSALEAVPLRRGSAICFHSVLLHGSAANTSNVPRRAVTLSYMGAIHRYCGAAPEPAYPAVSRA